MHFANFDIATFLRDYWQRKPLLIRNPWAGWANPLEPDELAGLACEEGVESRLIVGANPSWTLEHGPLPETRFAQLGASPWTLLVQAVDHHVPDVAALMEPFRFIPNWRIDDVMVSYATDGGGVGPHFDQYDVFLIQGLGRRRWQVGQRCDAASPLLPHEDLRLLADFAATEEWVLEPGDILYLPPGFAHDGVALGDDCMTYSIGFRAPSRGELIEAWSDEVLATLTDDDRYTDPGLAPQDNPGEISAEAMARLQRMVAEALNDRELFARAFGMLNSTPRYPEADWRPEEPITPAELEAELAAGAALCRNPASRFAYFAPAADRRLLFVDGQCFTCRGDAIALAEAMCAAETLIPGDTLDTDRIELLCKLINQGSLGIADDS